MLTKNRIGLFDSGLGGLSVLNSLWRETKNTHFIYYADLDNGPYGKLPKEEVILKSKAAVNLLLEKKVDAVLFACNSATSAAADFLRQTHSTPIFGMEPAVKPASLENPGKPIAIFATELTLKEEKFKSLLERMPGHSEYVPVPCEGLAKMIDAGEFSAAWDFLNQKIKSIIEKTDILVLGCTHYVFLKDKIREFYPQAKVYDGNLGTSLHMKNLLNLSGETENSLDILLNTTNSKFKSVADELVSHFCDSFTITLYNQIGENANV